MSETTPPGWYPTDDEHVMFWDGTQWIEGTKQLRAEGSQGQPMIPPPPDRAATKPWYARWYSILGFIAVGLFMFMFTVTALTTENKEDSVVAPASQSAEPAETEPPAETQQPATPAPTQTTPAPKPTETTKAPKKPATKVTVEDGVGMSYQDAQDLWRSQGLVIMPAEDGTGANRLPFLDSNWYVVAQDIDPGTRVATGTAITATVLKYRDR